MVLIKRYCRIRKYYQNSANWIRRLKPNIAFFYHVTDYVKPPYLMLSFSNKPRIETREFLYCFQLQNRDATSLCACDTKISRRTHIHNQAAGYSL